MYTGQELAPPVCSSSLRVLVAPLSDLKNMFDASEEEWRSRSRVKSRVSWPPVTSSLFKWANSPCLNLGGQSKPNDDP